MGGRIKNFLGGAALAIASTQAAPAFAASEPYLGDIMPVGFNFCPRGWTQANGQLLPIASNQALYSLYGTTYGGDGRTTFGLPSMSGRVVVGEGQGPGLTNRRLGSKFGRESVILRPQNLPPHKHNIMLGNAGPSSTTDNPDGNMPASHTATNLDRYNQTGALGEMAQGSLSSTSSNEISLKKSTLGIQWCVALEGTFPPRS